MSPELLSHILAIAVSFGVAVSILRRARLDRDGPALLLAAAVGFDFLEWLFWTLAAFTPARDTPLGEALAVACRIGISAAVACLLVFTRRVFRPDRPEAALLAWLLIGAMGAGFLGAGALGDWAGYRNDHVWNWIELAAQIAGYGWTSAESLAYHLKLRRRVALGLADPVVANRLLLWSVYAGMYCLSQLGYGAVLAFAAQITALDTLLAAFTIAGQIALWLAFFPPAWLVRWLRSGAPAAP